MRKVGDCEHFESSVLAPKEVCVYSLSCLLLFCIFFCGGSLKSLIEANGTAHLENPMNRGAWWLQSMGSLRVGLD